MSHERRRAQSKGRTSKHGKFRPTLLKFVMANSERDVRERTEAAFDHYERNKADISKPLAELIRLRGIGPATASLILSCYDPVAVPFFSDEYYHFTSWQAGERDPWTKKIAYTLKEYKLLYEQVRQTRLRLESEAGHPVSALDLEKVAYVLGKEEGGGLGDGATNGLKQTATTPAADTQPHSSPGSKHSEVPSKNKRKKAVDTTESRVKRKKS